MSAEAIRMRPMRLRKRASSVAASPIDAGSEPELQDHCPARQRGADGGGEVADERGEADGDACVHQHRDEGVVER